MNRGYIKIWRKCLDSDLLRNPALWQFMCWCLLKATHKPHRQIVGARVVELLPGQLVFGRAKAARELDSTERKVRTCLGLLQKLGFLTVCATNKYSVVSIVNWESYQADGPAHTRTGGRQMTGTRPATGHKQAQLTAEHKIPLHKGYALAGGSDPAFAPPQGGELAGELAPEASAPRSGQLPEAGAARLYSAGSARPQNHSPAAPPGPDGWSRAALAGDGAQPEAGDSPGSGRAPVPRRGDRSGWTDRDGKRPEDAQAGGASAGSGPDAAGTGMEFLDPGMEFLELRELYDRHGRAEGPLSGFAEFKQAKAARDWPGMARIAQAVESFASRDCQWQRGCAVGLGRFIRERWWLREPRLEPRQSRDAPAKTPQQAARDKAEAERMLKAIKDKARAEAGKRLARTAGDKGVEGPPSGYTRTNSKEPLA